MPLKTKSGAVDKFNILLDSGSARSFIPSLAIDKLETNPISVENLTCALFGSSNVTQSGLRNLYEVNLSASVHERCLGVETISSEIFKSKLSSDVIKELNQNAGGRMEYIDWS